MKRLTNSLFPLIFILICFTACWAQEQDSPRPDRWRELVLDQSTPEDAIHTLGVPKTDKVDRIRTEPLNKRIADKQKERVFRELRYENIELSFFENKLVMLELKPEKKIDAGALESIYKISFEPKISGFDTAMNPKDYERH